METERRVLERIMPVSYTHLDVYKRQILHRACHIKPEGVYFAGDAQTRLEGPVAQERMVARAVAATRKGKQIAPGSFWWVFFRGFWRWIRPARPFFMGVYGKVHALAGHKHEQHRKQ